MTHAEFIAGLRDAIEWSDGTFDAKTELRGHQSWDSAGVMSAILFIDERLGTTVSAKSLEDARTVADVVKMVSESLEN
jgi:acyl carrier protein